MKIPFSWLIVVLVGVPVLLGIFFPGPLGWVQEPLLHWAVILAAFALLVGTANLFRVHWIKVSTGQSGAVYSVVLLVVLVATIIVSVVLGGPTGKWPLWIFNNIQLPVETSLVAVLAVVLASASVRLVRRRTGLLAAVFIVTILIILLGTVPLYWVGEIPGLNGLRNWVAQVAAAGGARGLLLGVALGTVATGLRVLLGADRPYGG